MPDNIRPPVALVGMCVALTLAVFSNFMSAPSETLLAVSTGAVVVCALAVTVGLWGRKSWALAAYIVWAVAIVASQFLIDSRVESVAWKVALGGTIYAVFLLCFGGIVKNELARK